MGARLAIFLVVLSLLVPSAQATGRTEPDERLSPDIQQWQQALRTGEPTRIANLRFRWGIKEEQGLTQIELHLAAGANPESWADGVLRQMGGWAGDRGTDVLNIWIPLNRLEELLVRQPDIAYARWPQRPHAWQGKVMSQGATQLRNSKQVCLGAEGTGVTVALVDEGFEGFSDSAAAGELAQVTGTVSETGGPHGTMCAQVVADVAPGALIYPFLADSLAAIQKFANSVTKKNVHNIRVVSHSVGWFGMSFGRHDGPLCAVTDQVRAAGVAWVNAAGNNGDGHFYQGAYTPDAQGVQHLFEKDQPRLTFEHHGGDIQMNVDWDDYTNRTVDFNVVLERLDQGSWVQVDESSSKQGKYAAPVEMLGLQGPPGGKYAIRIVCKANCTAGVRLRAVMLSGGQGPFSVWTRHGNVYDPGSCKDVLTVGAVNQNVYTTGPLEGFSSFGPTVDGRLKPEVVAPDGTASTFGDFYGTSSACPHTAGVVALYISAGLEPKAAMQAVIDDAIGMGQARPDDAYGWGRVQVRGETMGWQCDASDLSQSATCDTACFTIGTRSCTAQCHLAECQPPVDGCNGVDDNCDGVTDEGASCALGEIATCTTSCGSVGSRQCGTGCTWQACKAPTETCNGVDDDCDGVTDNTCGDAGLQSDGSGSTGQATAASASNSAGCQGGRTSGGGWLAMVVGLGMLWRRRVTQTRPLYMQE